MADSNPENPTPDNSDIDISISTEDQADNAGNVSESETDIFPSNPIDVVEYHQIMILNIIRDIDSNHQEATLISVIYNGIKGTYSDRITEYTAAVHYPNLGDAYMSRDALLIRPHTLSDTIVAAIYNLAAFGKMSDSNMEVLERIKAVYPNKYGAFMRDFSRIVANKQKIKKTKIFPKVKKKSRFEDPFGIGAYQLAKFAADRFDNREVDKIVDFINADQRTRICDFIGKLPVNLSTSVQTILIKHILSDLAGPVQLHEGKASRIWEYYSKLLPNSSFDDRFLLFLKLHDDLPKEEKLQVFGRMIMEFFEGPPKKDKNSIHILASVYSMGNESYFSYYLKVYKNIFAHFAKLAANGNAFEKVFAFKVLADYCNREEGGAMERVKEVIKAVFGQSGLINNDSAVPELVSFLTGLKDYSKKTDAVLDALCEGEKIYAYSIKDYQESPDKTIKKLFLKYPVLRLFSADQIERALEKQTEIKEASRQLYEALKKLNFEPNFDVLDAISDIRSKTSLPLIEEMQVDVKGVLPADYKVTLFPNRHDPQSLASWSVNIHLFGIRNGILINELLQLDFVDCVIINDIPDDVKETLTRIGVFAAHKYYVRQKSNEPISERPEPKVNPSGPGRVEDTIPPPEPESQPENDPIPDSESMPLSIEEPAAGSPVVMGRKEKPLTLDIRERDQKAVKPGSTIKTGIKDSMINNKRRIIKLLNGETEGIDIDKVKLHRKVEGFSPGRYIFEYVKPEEVRKVVEEGTLTEQDWYVINTMPHTKALSYYRVMAQTEVSRSAGEKPHIWLASRQSKTDDALLAYEEYRNAGFPELSPFADISAAIGITVSTKTETGHLMCVYPQGCLEEKLHGVAEKRDHNGKLASMVTDEVWMGRWIESQLRSLYEIIEECLGTIADSEKKNELKAGLEQLLTDLTEIVKLTLFLEKAAANHTSNSAKDAVYKQIYNKDASYKRILRQVKSTLCDVLPENQHDLQEEVYQVIELLLDLPELKRKIINQSCVSVRDVNGKTSAMARLMLGWIPTTTTFVQGNYISLQNLMEDITRPDANHSDPEPSSQGSESVRCNTLNYSGVSSADNLENEHDSV